VSLFVPDGCTNLLSALTWQKDEKEPESTA
jgi:hypothetical protein